MNENNQSRLRESANRLIQAVGNDEKVVFSIIPLIESLIKGVQKYQVSIKNQNETKSAESAVFPSIEYMNTEKRRIAIRMGSFDSKDNRVWQEISRRFGANIKQAELTNIAQVIADSAQIKLDRDAKRRKSVLLKWFDEHWNEIHPFLDFVVIGDDESDKNE